MGWPGLLGLWILRRYYMNEVQGWGLKRRDISSMDTTWKGTTVVMRLESSELNIGVQS